MNQDGEIDYSHYSYRELLEALNNIDSRNYPENYRNLQKALEAIGPEQREALERGAEPIPIFENDMSVEHDKIDPDTRRIAHLLTALGVSGISAYLLWVADITIPLDTPLTISLAGFSRKLAYAALVLAATVPLSFVVDYMDTRDNRNKYLLFAYFAETAATGLIGFACFISVTSG